MTTTFKTFGIVALVLMAVALPMAAQSGVQFTKTGALTATNANCTATACVSMPVTSLTNTIGIQVTGTFVGTVTFEVTVDGTNWVAAAAVVTAATTARVTTATAAGLWQLPVAGFVAARVRCSAFTSGTINVTMNRSAASPSNGS
jgi:hypothetical protein